MTKGMMVARVALVIWVTIGHASGDSGSRCARLTKPPAVGRAPEGHSCSSFEAFGHRSVASVCSTVNLWCSQWLYFRKTSAGPSHVTYHWVEEDELYANRRVGVAERANASDLWALKSNGRKAPLSLEKRRNFSRELLGDRSTDTVGTMRVRLLSRTATRSCAQLICSSGLS